MIHQTFSRLSGQSKSKSNRYVVPIGIGTFYDMKDIKTEIHGRKLKVSGCATETLKEGSTQHRFEREYDIPEDVDLSTLKSSLTEDGTLNITFKRMCLEPKKKVKFLLNDKEFKMRISMEGFKPEEISIRVVDRYLVVEATRKSNKINEDRKKIQSSSGYILRTIRLGDDVDVDNLRAVSSNGVIEISSPIKSHRSIKKGRKLEIEQL
ncbi:Heat shock protein Hsp-16.48/Hsp-16.49 [Thelohanellus kitauei]|uniref:Heat shock protein Hsp-16.48/Hsp-16.49 n=1 Tax=Thelohanellus kitauei TaxID=669202 RepID=A0A0C2JL76_THEKT|nr:Heat shock protein Hsp-16.48/Hsp-16.49 [Thelohanellus kitauei]